MQKKFYIVITLVLSFIAFYFLIFNNLSQNKFNFIDKFLDEGQKKTVKKYIFPYSYINKLENESNSVLKYDLKRKKN